MPDNNQPKTEIPEALIKVLGKSYDEIKGFGEGIAQTIYMFFLNMSFLQKLVVLGLLGYLSKGAFHELRKIIKDDPELVLEDLDEIHRQEFLDMFEEYGEKAWQAMEVFFKKTVDAYHHLANADLIDPKELQAYLLKIKKTRNGYEKSLQRSQTSRKWYLRGYAAVFILLVFVSTASADVLITSALITVVVSIIGVVVWFLFFRNQNSAVPERTAS